MRIFILLFMLAPLFLWGQYPDNPRKLRLGFQTTGAGLTYIKDGAPAHTPGDDEDAWMVLDTANNVLYYWDETAGAWENILDDITQDTVFQITNVPDTTTLAPMQGDAFINSTADTLGLYNGAGWVLFFGGSGGGAVSDTTRFFVYAPAHGLEDSISAYGYVPVKADFTKANSSTLDSTHFAYAVGAPHVDTLELKLSGPLVVTAHGLIVGRLYYLQDDGTQAVTPGTVRAPTVYVLDANTVVLTEVGADQDQVISRQAVPSPVFTFWGGDPQNPSDSIMQIVVDSVFAPAGLAKPSTIFFMSYSSQSKNPTYQDDSPTDSPLNPSHSWFYDGNVVTRMNHLLTSVDLQATSAGLFTLDTVQLVGGIPTDSTVANWLDTNYVQNNLRLPNGAILYWKGDGTAQSPQYKWVVIDDITNTGESNGYKRILKNLSSSPADNVTGTGSAGQVAYWSGTNTLTGNANMTYSSPLLTLGGTGASLLLTPTSAPVNAAGKWYTSSGNYPHFMNGTTDWPLVRGSAESFTPGSVLFAGTSGQAQQDNASIFFSDADNRLHIGGNSPAYTLSIGVGSKGFDQYTSSTGQDAIKVANNSGGATFGVQNNNASGYSGIEYLDNAGSLAVFTGYRNGGTGEFRFNNISTNGHITFKIASTDAMVISNGRRVGIGNSSPQRTLHVTGEARITDLTTDTPTRIVGADADGDLGEMTAGTGISFAGGQVSSTITDTHIGNTNLTIPAVTRTLTFGSAATRLNINQGGVTAFSFKADMNGDDDDITRLTISNLDGDFMGAIGFNSSEMIIENRDNDLRLHADGIIALSSGLEAPDFTLVDPTGSNYSGYTLRLGDGPGQAQFYDNTSGAHTGLEYAADYSADFVERSLVDKGYVDTLVLGISTNLSADDVPVWDGAEFQPSGITSDGSTILLTEDFPFLGGYNGAPGAGEDGYILTYSDTDGGILLQPGAFIPITLTEDVTFAASGWKLIMNERVGMTIDDGASLLIIGLNNDAPAETSAQMIFDDTDGSSTWGQTSGEAFFAISASGVPQVQSSTLGTRMEWDTDEAILYINDESVNLPNINDASALQPYNVVMTSDGELRKDTVYTRVYGYMYGAPLDSIDVGGATDQASITGWSGGGYNSGHWTYTDSSMIYSGPTHRCEVSLSAKLIGGAAGDVEIRIGYSVTAGGGTLILPNDQQRRVTLSGGSAREDFYTSCQIQVGDGYEIKARGARGDFGIREARLRVMQID